MTQPSGWSAAAGSEITLELFLIHQNPVPFGPKVVSICPSASKRAAAKQ